MMQSEDDSFEADDFEHGVKMLLNGTAKYRLFGIPLIIVDQNRSEPNLWRVIMFAWDSFCNYLNEAWPFVAFSKYTEEFYVGISIESFPRRTLAQRYMDPVTQCHIGQFLQSMRQCQMVDVSHLPPPDMSSIASISAMPLQDIQLAILRKYATRSTAPLWRMVLKIATEVGGKTDEYSFRNRQQLLKPTDQGNDHDQMMEGLRARFIEFLPRTDYNTAANEHPDMAIGAFETEGMGELEALPIYQQQEEIMAVTNRRDVVIVKAPTASGKSILIPLILWWRKSEEKLTEIMQQHPNWSVERAWEDVELRLAVLLPTRVACISVSSFVGQIMLNRQRANDKRWVHCQVGYAIGNDNSTAPRNDKSITFCTFGMGRAWTVKDWWDSFLTKCEILLFDEVHELCLENQLVLYIVSAHLIKRGRCKKLVCMSATIDTAKLAAYLHDMTGKEVEALDITGRIPRPHKLHIFTMGDLTRMKNKHMEQMFDRKDVTFTEHDPLDPKTIFTFGDEFITPTPESEYKHEFTEVDRREEAALMDDSDSDDDYDDDDDDDDDEDYELTPMEMQAKEKAREKANAVAMKEVMLEMAFYDGDLERNAQIAVNGEENDNEAGQPSDQEPLTMPVETFN